MKFKYPEIHPLTLTMALIVLAILLGLLMQNFGEEPKANSPDLLVYVDEPHFHLFAREISSFDHTLRKGKWLKVQPLPEKEAIEAFRKHPESMLVLNRQLTAEDISLEDSRLPLQHEKMAIEKKDGVTIPLFLIQDQQVSDLERKFADFVIQSKGQKILKEEGLEPQN